MRGALPRRGSAAACSSALAVSKPSGSRADQCFAGFDNVLEHDAIGVAGGYALAAGE